MPAYKRTADGEEKHTMEPRAPKSSTATMSPFIPIFETFRDELDERHDRRDRIGKASRDITALSKKIIFSLQRVRQLKAPISPDITKVTLPHYEAIQKLFDSIKEDLNGMNAWRYHRQISGGIQEFMEAASFQYYLETQYLISHEEAQTKLPEGIQLTEDDYVLGLFDLSGELMKYAITSMATNGQLPGGSHKSSDMENGAEDLKESRRDMAMDLRSLRTYFEAMYTKGFALDHVIGKKMEVMQTSVEKVENAVYGMIVRGRERPTGWVPDLREEVKAEPIESY